LIGISADKLKNRIIYNYIIYMGLMGYTQSLKKVISFKFHNIKKSGNTKDKKFSSMTCFCQGHLQSKPDQKRVGTMPQTLIYYAEMRTEP